MNEEKYNKIVEGIESSLSKYDYKYHSNSYGINLANGDFFSYRIPEGRLAHMLGVNIDFMRLNNLVRNNTDSFAALGYFIDNCTYYSLYRNKIKISNLFSDYIEEKIKAFDVVCSSPRFDNIYAIIKYDNERTYTSEPVSDICDYYIINKIENEYYILGLVKEYENNEKYYVPATVRYYDDDEKFNKFLERIAKNQVITYPFKVSVNNYNNDYHKNVFLPIVSRQDYLKRIINVSKKYHSITDVSQDYLASLGQQSNSNNNSHNLLYLLITLSNAMEKGIIVDRDTLNKFVSEQNRSYSEIKRLVDNCNNMIASSSSNDYYSVLQDENSNLKNELTELRKKLLSIKDENSDLQDRNSSLEEENSKNSQKLLILNNAFNEASKI